VGQTTYSIGDLVLLDNSSYHYGALYWRIEGWNDVISYDRGHFRDYQIRAAYPYDDSVRIVDEMFLTPLSQQQRDLLEMTEGI
jgi:hypothetical protein